MSDWQSNLNEDQIRRIEEVKNKWMQEMEIYFKKKEEKRKEQKDWQATLDFGRSKEQAEIEDRYTAQIEEIINGNKK